MYSRSATVHELVVMFVVVEMANRPPYSQGQETRLGTLLLAVFPCRRRYLTRGIFPSAPDRVIAVMA